MICWHCKREITRDPTIDKMYDPPLTLHGDCYEKLRPVIANRLPPKIEAFLQQCAGSGAARGVPCKESDQCD